ncbi:MAG TPA: hypothetical protein DCQ87_00930 [Lachnospiraceae bacterium]|nr:hypothetical protein [Lachnospiraceae bacterium]MDD7665102.1 hypothetical protein [Lachnospiraceae bacterium]MDY4165535.1 hypothetical protein [Lachnospiraceae bacterium]HAP02604.1 hypothetical protein [Lachnospiraceae bacterium]
MPFAHCKDTGTAIAEFGKNGYSGGSLNAVCATLASEPSLVRIVQGTIAAAAIINEFIAVFAAKKGFELAGEINVGTV